eukprot:scaffold10651_cov112-Isochrysis_galbana.AAC.3
MSFHRSCACVALEDPSWVLRASDSACQCAVSTQRCVYIAYIAVSQPSTTKKFCSTLQSPRYPSAMSDSVARCEGWSRKTIKFQRWRTGARRPLTHVASHHLTPALWAGTP